MLIGLRTAVGDVLEAVLDPLVQGFIAVLVPVALFTADQIDDGLKLTIDGLQISDQGIG